MRHKRFTATLGVTGLALLLFGANYAFAHCDGLDGPVVKAAQNALQTNNVNLVLIWVQKESEPELKAVFQQTVAVRKLSLESKALADRQLFETLVRLHRSGKAYVEYIHFVERLHEATTTPAAGHYAENESRT